MAAGSLTIKGTTYQLKATNVTYNKDRFYTLSEGLDGTTNVNESGNTAKRRWNYTGQCSKSIVDSLETALDSGITGTFTDHTGTEYTSCIFELTKGNQTGNYTIMNWSLNVIEV